MQLLVHNILLILKLHNYDVDLILLIFQINYYLLVRPIFAKTQKKMDC